MSGSPKSACGEPVPAEARPGIAQKLRRLARMLGALGMLAAGFLAGLVLLIYPWLEWWEENFFSSWLPLWGNGYLRGAIAGLGAVTLALSLSSMVRIRRR